jgi:spore coat polysaccharide biosynthesis protein SpsF (cytidylyltransferase family)
MKWKDLENQEKAITDEELINNYEKWNMNYVFQKNRFREDTLALFIDMVDIKIIIKYQKFSVEFANKYIVDRILNYVDRDPPSMNDVIMFQ